MAQQTINSDPIHPFGPPNIGIGTEFGDTWEGAVTKLNAMFNDLYGTTMPAGGGTATFGASGDIAKIAGLIQSSGTTATQTLASFSMPANTLNAVGQCLQVEAWGYVGSNAAPKSVTLAVGGASMATGTQTGSGYSWLLECGTMLIGSNLEDNIFTGQSSGAIIAPKHQTDTSVTASAITIAVTMADASAATGNVVLGGFTVEYFR